VIGRSRILDAGGVVDGGGDGGVLPRVVGRLWVLASSSYLRTVPGAARHLALFGVIAGQDVDIDTWWR
jgi:hypothetical protein